MGAGCQKQVDNSLYQGQQYFYNLFNILRNYINIIEDAKMIKLNVYLIATKSIPNFISLIKKHKFLDNDDATSAIILDKDESYELEKNIEVINQFSQCNNLIQKDNGKNNEFIIVNKDFIKNMKIMNSENKDVEITIDRNKNINTIKFSDSKTINFNSIQKGFYKFFIFDQSTINPNINFYISPNTNLNLNSDKTITYNSNYTFAQLQNGNVIFPNIMNQIKNSEVSNFNRILNNVLNQNSN